MTKSGADKIKEQLQSLDVEQFGLLWRWINAEYFSRLDEAAKQRLDEAAKQKLWDTWHPKEPQTYA